MSRTTKVKKTKKSKKQRLGSGILIILLALVLIYGIFAAILIGPKTTLDVGEIAEETVTAPRAIEDTYSTEVAKQDARNAVGPSYSRDEQISEKVLIDLAAALTAIDAVRLLGKEEYNRMRDSGEEIKYTVEFYEECLKELPEGFITGDVVNIIQIEDEEEYIRLKEVVTNIITSEMDSGIVESALEARKTDLQSQLILSGFNNEVRKLGSTLIDIYLTTNMIFDVEGTEKAKEKAADLVEPIIYNEGDIIVKEGDTITAAQLEMLKVIGYVEDKNAGWIDYTAIGIVVLILCFLAVCYLTSFNKDIAFTNKTLSLTLLIIITDLLLLWLIREIDIDVYFVLTSYVPLMLYILLGDKRLSIYMNALVSLMMGFMYIRVGEGILLPIVLAAVVSGTFSVYLMKNDSQRSSMFFSGAISGIIMGIVYVAFDLMNHATYKKMMLDFLWGTGSGVIVAVLALGTLPFFEAAYKVVTPMKLMELANPNQPLLKKLLLEAPGTYHHSIMVGNMAERAADAIGANGLLVRTAAYYHDVGKTKRPAFFVENHMDSRNPHDNINSKSSVDVITSHLSDGVDMLRRANIPPIVQEIVGQHHGDTAVMYFYSKDKEETNYPENIKIDNYRYKGERPTSKEAGILMLADSCEAAVRSMENATRDMVQDRIDAVVKGKFDDGQLDYCDLTLQEITTIKEAFLIALTGLFHERIEYPDSQKLIGQGKDEDSD